MYNSEPPELERRLIPNETYDALNPRMKVAIKILEYNDVDHRVAYFSRLVKDLEKEVSRTTIHQALDSLIDQGAVRSEWVEIKPGRWVRGYKPASEGQRKMLRRAYFATHDLPRR